MSDYLDPNNQELLKDFFSEARAQIDTLEQNILVLEHDTANHDAIDEIFRAAHTLKGGAGTVEMSELAGFTHVIEDLLDSIRSNTVKVDGPVIDALLAGIDVVKAMLDARMAGSVYATDTAELKTRLTSFIPKSAGKASVKPASVPKPEVKKQAVASGLSEYELLELCAAAGNNKKIYLVTANFDESNVMNTVSSIHAFASLRDSGNVLKTEPDFEQLYEDVFYPTVKYYVATERGIKSLEDAINIPDVVVSATVDEIQTSNISVKPVKESDASKKALSSQPATTEPKKIEQAAAKAKVEPSISQAELENVLHHKNGAENMTIDSDNSPASEVTGYHDDKSPDSRKSTGQSGSILRVDSKRIDNLLNQVSEAVINKATFNQIAGRFAELQSIFQATQAQFRDKLKNLFDELPNYTSSQNTSGKDTKKEIFEKYGNMYNSFDMFEAELKNNVAKFRATAQNLGRITGELQEGVMRIRMVPISQIFSRFPRLVRDLSKTLNKKVNLVIDGEETELDKSVIEDLLDPLMHSVRNALDHGIESPEERRAAGKAEEGTVMLRASNEGSMIIIEIADDGKGINVESIRTKAIERGLIHPNKIITETEAFNLIFDAGFSTASSVTNISGRGVGLDVVKRQIEKLNGSVMVSSQRGKGSKFTIKLPLTLAIIQGLLVRVGKETYSIPITSVVESHRIQPSEIRMIDNYEVFNVRNDVVSLLRLNRLFRIQTDEQGEYCFIVVVGTSDKRVGLMVDSLIGEEDVVIKPLRDQFTNSPGVAGASILGDGSVCLILDVSQLLELGQQKELEERQRFELTLR